MKINEVFYSLQGEGNRVGTSNIFVRFSGCNLACGYCDTEFESGVVHTNETLIDEISRYDCRSIIFTGGEPAIQLIQNKALIQELKKFGYFLAIETNGTINVDDLNLDWITVSPKVAEHAIKQKVAMEVKYVRGYGQGLPETVIISQYKYISPMFDGNILRKETLEWCIDLVKKNPPWRLTMQYHKFWNVR